MHPTAYEKSAAEKAAAEKASPPEKTTKEKHRFVLLAGSHSETQPDGVTINYDYDRNVETIVESEKDLDVLFMNKFRRLDGDTDLGRDYDVSSLDRPEQIMDASMAERFPDGLATPFTGDMERAAKAKQEAEWLEHPPKTTKRNQSAKKK